MNTAKIHGPRIAVARKGALGDVILTTPVVEYLSRIHQGNATIDVITDSPEVYDNSPYATGKKAPDGAYTTFFDLNNVYEMNTSMHFTDAYFQFMFGSSASTVQLSPPALYPSEYDKNIVTSKMGEMCLDKGKYIVVHMRKHHWPNKNLPIAFWAKFVKGVLDKTEHDIVMIGYPSEIAFDGSSALHNCLGMFTIQQNKLLIENAAAFVGSDSAPLHIAATTTTPIISMYTIAHHKRTQPKRSIGQNIIVPANVPCYGCQETFPAPYNQPLCHTNDYRCVDSFDADAIVDKLVNIGK